MTSQHSGCEVTWPATNIAVSTAAASCEVTWLPASIVCCNWRIACCDWRIACCDRRITVSIATASCDHTTPRLCDHMTCCCACLMQQLTHCKVKGNCIMWPCNIQVVWSHDLQSWMRLLDATTGALQGQWQLYHVTAQHSGYEVIWLAIALAQCCNWRIAVSMICVHLTSMLCGHLTHSQHCLLQPAHQYSYYLW